jgi:hypothetical protein
MLSLEVEEATDVWAPHVSEMREGEEKAYQG